MAMIYTAFNHETNSELTFTEEEYETYIPEIRLGTIEVMECIDTEDDIDFTIEIPTETLDV